MKVLSCVVFLLLVFVSQVGAAEKEKVSEDVTPVPGTTALPEQGERNLIIGLRSTSHVYDRCLIIGDDKECVANGQVVVGTKLFGADFPLAVRQMIINFPDGFRAWTLFLIQWQQEQFIQQQAKKGLEKIEELEENGMTLPPDE